MSISSTQVKVAIIDDHALMRNCLFNCLSIWGYDVIITAANTNDFLNQISEDNLPAICIIEINMPFSGGYDTIYILRHNWPSIKIVVYSLNIEFGKPGRLNGADAVISKFDHVTLLKTTLSQLSGLK